MDVSVWVEESGQAERAVSLKRRVPDLGARIARLREEKRLSRAALARGLGVSRDRVAKWEHEKNEPPVEMLIALGDALGVTLDELVIGRTATAPAMHGGLNDGTVRAIARLVAELEGLLRSAGIMKDAVRGEGS
jgi:transcriptional regulator with XRE-family HTH domain